MRTWPSILAAVTLCGAFLAGWAAACGDEPPKPADSQAGSAAHSPSTAPAATAVGSGWLHTDGRFIKDAAGNVVVPRGVNTYVRLQNEQAKYAAIKALGANVVRLMLWKEDIEKPSPTLDPKFDRTGLAAIDRAVGWAREAGLKVILVEQIWSYQVDSAPGTFLTDPELQASWLVMWRTLVDRYKNDSTVVGIDLMNEPYIMQHRSADRIPASVKDPLGAWEQVAKKAVADLRTRNPNLLFVVEGWGPRTIPNWKDAEFLKQSNVVFSSHIYYTGAASWSSWAKAYADGKLAEGKDLLEKWIDKMWGDFTKQGIPVWIGEVGFLTTDPNWKEQMLDELALFDARGIGYAAYTVGVARWSGPFDMVDPAGLPSYRLSVIGKAYSDHLQALSAKELKKVEKRAKNLP